MVNMFRLWNQYLQLLIKEEENENSAIVVHWKFIAAKMDLHGKLNLVDSDKDAVFQGLCIDYFTIIG